MQLDDIANPLLRLPEMRTSGVTLLSHAGQKPLLGAGQQMLFGIVSPVEFIFRETKMEAAPAVRTHSTSSTVYARTRL
jgi:hypothetical protein